MNRWQSRVRCGLAATAMLLMLPAQAAPGLTVVPQTGTWSQQLAVTVNGRALPAAAAATDNDAICLSADDFAATQNPKTWLGAMQDDDSACRFPQSSFSGNQIHYQGQCKAGDGAITQIEATGVVVDPKTINMKISASGNAHGGAARMLHLRAGEPYTLQYSGVMHWLSAGCTAAD